MTDYKTFKKEYLNEWVDRSQAARKAAEELAMKDVKTSLRDKYKPEGLVFDLDGHKVEFKAENEKNLKDSEYNFFTWDEAIACQKDGWRLLTKEELEALCNYPYEFDDNSKQGVFDKRLYLPAAGLCGRNGNVDYVGSDGWYWSSTPCGLGNAWYFSFDLDRVRMYSDLRRFGFSVRLVRDVK